MLQLTPRVHLPKSKKNLKGSDVWPVDIVIEGKDKWVMTSEGVCVPYRGYIGYYSHRIPEPVRTK